MPIAVTTPTGNIGRRVVQRLSEAGEQVVVLARDPAKLDPPRAHVTSLHGDLTDPVALDQLLAGAEALFLLVPLDVTSPDITAHQRAIARTAADAVRRHGTPRVVLVSSIGAQRRDLGLISTLGEAEERLAATGTHLVSLRAAYFMENLLAQLGNVLAQGLLVGAFAPTATQPMVATRDIGDVAAALLRDRQWAGQVVRGVHGPADRSQAEAAFVIGQALGRPVEYVQVPPEAMGGALREQGASASFADAYATMVRGTSSGPVGAEPRTAATTTPTTLEQFVREVFVPAARAAGGA